MMKKTITALTLTLLPLVAMTARCPITFQGNDAAIVGIYIQDLKTGKMVADYQSSMAMTPASILKALTCATALNMLGPDYRFTTDFLLVGENPKAGEADLVVVGTADPTTGSRDFKESASVIDSVMCALKDASVTSIAGDVLINGSILPEGGGVVPQWEVEDVTESYGVGLFPVNWMDNYFESDYIIPSPPDYFKEILTQKLTLNGINVAGNMVELGADSLQPDTLCVLTHRSPVLKEIMRSLMYRSDNLMAEATLRALAPGQPRDSALSTVRDFWKRQGVDLKFTRLLDGNGLSRGNAISAAQMGRILTYMARSEFCADYVSLFPHAAKDGTVKSLLRGTRLAGRLAVKSGSMSGVHCYAGYKLDKAGRPTHTVVIMVNNFFCKRTQLKQAIENYLLNILP